jgi:hypothetical protein
MPSPARLIGAGMTMMNSKPPSQPVQLMAQALQIALNDAKLDLNDLDGVIGLPSLMGNNHFMPVSQLVVFQEKGNCVSFLCV